MPTPAPMKQLCVIALCAWGTPLVAQTSQPADGRLLRVGIDSFTVSYGGQMIGRAVQATERAVEGGVRAWKQAYAFTSAHGEVSTDTLLMDGMSLRPLREARVNTLGRFNVAFTPREVVTISQAADAKPVTRHAPIDGPIYSSAALDAVVRALPLRDGLATTITFFYPVPSDRGAVGIKIRVTGSDSLTMGGRVRSAWVVVAGDPGEATTFWIDKTDHTVLQFDTEEGQAVIKFRR